MKVLIVLALIATVAFAQSIDHNGQPGCQTAEEIQQIRWRNNWDPTRFWQCNELGQNGVAVTCFEHTGLWGQSYQSEIDACVPSEDWVWSAPQERLSEPRN